MEDVYELESSDSEGSVEVVATRSHVSEAKQLIYLNDDISIQNAILFNKQLQNNLQLLKSRLENMLRMCIEKYKENEKVISDLSEASSAKSTNGFSFYMCGYPYFKDRGAFPAPCPEEYFTRRKTEVFPITLDNRNVFWLLRDKIQLIQGVKKQLIQFIRTKNKDRIRKITTRTKASQAGRILKGISSPEIIKRTITMSRS